MNDHQLMDAIAEGDSAAIENLLATYQPRVLRFLLGNLRSEQDALEITQEVMVRVCRNARSYNGSAPLAAWIFRITRNLLIDLFRSRGFKNREATIEIDLHHPALRATDPSPESEVIRHEVLQRIQSAMDELPPRQREVVQMRLLGELKLEEIAQAVGLTPGGVKSTLHNALRSLRSKLSDLEKETYVTM